MPREDSPSASNIPRSAGIADTDRDLARQPLAHVSSGSDLRRQHAHRLLVAFELAAHQDQRAGFDQAGARW